MKFGALFSRIWRSLAARENGPGGEADGRDGSSSVPVEKNAQPREAPQMGLWEALCRAKVFPSEKPPGGSGGVDVKTLSTWGAFSMSRL